MSLYREARTRRVWPIAVATIIGTAAGFAIGVLIAGSGEPDLSEALEPMREEVQAALDSLELVAIEYEQGLGSGPAAAETEDEAAAAHLDRARSSFEAAEADLILLDPEAAEQAAAALDALDAAIEGAASASEVERLTAEAESALASAAGIER